MNVSAFRHSRIGERRKNMPYLYETHLHTSEASACGKTAGRDYIAFMMEKGYSGIIVTDHFFNGNSCIPKDLPWKERVERYCSGYEHAKEEAAGKDFDVFFGIEYNFEGDEYLLYGVEKDWLLEHPDLLSYTRHEVYAAVHEGGGIMVHAHPYRERRYLQAIHLTPSVCDGIEIYNAANEPYQNALDVKYAEELKLPMTAGSDIHLIGDRPLGGMLFERRLESVGDYARAVLACEGIPVSVYNGTVTPVLQIPEQCETDRKPDLPVFWHE